MKTQLLIAPKLITALLGVVLYFAGAYWYGITGIVIAGLLFSASYFLWMAALAKRQGIDLHIDATTKES